MSISTLSSLFTFSESDAKFWFEAIGICSVLLYLAGSIVKKRSVAYSFRGTGSILWLIYFSGLGVPAIGAYFCLLALFDLFSQIDFQSESQKAALMMLAAPVFAVVAEVFGGHIPDLFLCFAFIVFLGSNLYFRGRKLHQIAFFGFYLPVGLYCFSVPRSFSGVVFCLLMGLLGFIYSLQIYETVIVRKRA